MRVMSFLSFVPLFAICGALSAQNIPFAEELVGPPAGELVLASPSAAAMATEEKASTEKSAAEKPASEPPATAAPQPPTARQPIEWLVNNAKVKLGGYVKMDLIHDFNEIGSTDSFDPRTIPTINAEEPGTNTRLHARQTRLNLDVRAPTSRGEVRGFVEGDFFGDGNAFRMRHAYGTIGNVLAGQTWTTFMDPEAMPETLDFESPIAFPQVRQTMIRYTQPLEGKSYIAVALEDPDSDVQVPAGIAGSAEEPYPDLNGRIYVENAQGHHVQLGLFAGMARFDPVAGSPDDVPLWGANLSAKVFTMGKNNFIGQVTYGDGVGRYRGGTTAAPDAEGDLHAVTTFGILANYQHHWSDEYRSSIGYSWARGNLPNGAAVTSTEELGNFFVNFIWQFCERAWTGVEYLHGRRETADSHAGMANRIQFSIRFDF